MAKKKKFYAVARGRVPGIYTEWFGSKGAEVQIREFTGARFKGFYSREDALQWLADPDAPGTVSEKKAKKRTSVPSSPVLFDKGDAIIVYTDGGCSHNPGPGGYGAVVLDGGNRKEFSGGCRLTTNNRMELLACIVGLESLEPGSKVILYSDSKYVVDAVNKKWAVKWRSRNWVKADGKKALNSDLWARMLDVLARHKVSFNWVKGHAGNTENERCDFLATQAAAQPDLPRDGWYEKNR